MCLVTILIWCMVWKYPLRFYRLSIFYSPNLSFNVWTIYSDVVLPAYFSSFVPAFFFHNPRKYCQHQTFLKDLWIQVLYSDVSPFSIKFWGIVNKELQFHSFSCWQWVLSSRVIEDYLLFLCILDTVSSIQQILSIRVCIPLLCTSVFMLPVSHGFSYCQV